MTIEEILAKNNPVQPQRETSQSEYKKLVDTNTKLIDKMKYQEEEIEELKIKYNIMKENAELLAEVRDKAIKETSRQLKRAITQEYTDLRKILNILELKGSDK